MIRFSRDGKDFVCEAEQWLPRSREELWRFFSDCRHMNLVLPPFIRFHVDPQQVRPLGEGVTYDYRLKLHGFPLRWRTLVTSVNYPSDFEDIQARGPYASFAHRHDFVEQDGGTLTKDRIVYRPPGGALAHFVNTLVVQPDLKRLFEHRHRRMLELYADGHDPAALLDRATNDETPETPETPAPVAQGSVA